MDIKQFKDKVLEPMWNDKESHLRHGEYLDREEEIENFIPEEYWNIYADLLEPNSKKKFSE